MIPLSLTAIHQLHPVKGEAVTRFESWFKDDLPICDFFRLTIRVAPPPDRRGAKRETSRQGRYFILFVRPSLLAGLITPGRGTCLPSVIESTAEWSSEQRILVEHSRTLLFGLASRSQTRLVDDRVVTLAYRERTGSR